MSAVLAEQAVPLRAASAWHANLALRFCQQSRGCRLVSSVHHGPLYVQKPFYPEGADVAHVYLLHPPGGLVSGDRLGVNIRLEQNARVLVTTPGAGRVYRARSDRSPQQQSQHFDLAAGAVMEWLPQEMIVFPGAHGRMDTTVDMGASSTYLGWEICCLGLPASDLPFTHGELHQRLLICKEGRPLLLENLQLNKSSFALVAAKVGMNACPVSGIFVAGQLTDAADAEGTQRLVDELRQSLLALNMSGQANVTVTNEFIVGRYLGHSAEDARRAFIALWRKVRPLMTGRDACLPRIWAT